MAVVLQEKQARIVHTLRGPLFVSAGAGSGKTFTLTQRILYALKPGSKPREEWRDPAVPEPYLDSIDQVLAITFTNKAAQELKDRIARGLRAEGMEAEAEKVDNAWISTIHGMCSRIIRSHALDLDVDPAFTVVENPDALRRLAVEHVLYRVAAEDARGGSQYDALLGAFSLENAGDSKAVASLLSILVSMLSKASATVGGLTAFRQVSPAPSHRAIYDAYRDIAETPSYANAEAARAALEALDAYLASERDLPALRTCFAACSSLSKRGKGIGKDEKRFVDIARAARDSFFAESYLAARSDALDELMPLVREVEEEYRRIKRSRAVLDNDDLLTCAYDALQRDPRVRAEFSGKFKMVMVDEFQDTDQQQVELVRLLCSPDSHELCTVGDAQQSIYRFRGADVSVFRAKKDEVEQGAGGVVCDLDVNYRSHADILAFADRIFGGGASNPLGRDFLHLESCGEETRRGARTVRPETSRRQAVLVAGGTAKERAQVEAAAIAARFCRLRDEDGFAPGDMVILMARLTNADVYADAVRAAGMPCVVSGGTTVFRRAPEVGVIGALLAFLANPDDGEQGVAPLITSPMFELGATELLALATQVDAQTGIVDSRSVTGEVLISGMIMEDFGSLPLLDRARDVLGRACARVGRDRMSDIVRDAVAESGWLARLEQGGAAEHAVAANILKAISIIEEEEEGRAYAPRLVARAFSDHIEHVKESPAALNGSGEDAVRIMTVHASKGLEFPVVAVVECDKVSSNSDRLQLCDREGTVLWYAAPNRHDPASDAAMLETMPEPDEDDREQVPDRAAEAFTFMQRESTMLDYEERARLLYVAITRAREVVILGLSATHATELEPGHKTSVVGEVLSRIVPADAENGGLPDLGCDHLDFEHAHAGDYQLILLDDLAYPSKRKGSKRPQVTFSAADYPPPAGAVSVQSHDAEAEERDVLLVWPQPVDARVEQAPVPPRDSYSYTSVAAALHEVGEDRVPGAATIARDDDSAMDGDAGGPGREPGCEPGRAGHDGRDERGRHSGQDAQSADAVDDAAEAGDPTALGSAFHAAAQWLIETESHTVPPARIGALTRYWGLTPRQRERLEAALVRWEGSQVRADLVAWDEVRAEVPFFSFGMDDLRAQFGAYAEGAIDVLATDPARPEEALVLDYKTGGSSGETPEALHEKHALQARVYADVLHKAGYAHVTLKFVRVEVPDPENPTEPQVVEYQL